MGGSEWRTRLAQSHTSNAPPKPRRESGRSSNRRPALRWWFAGSIAESAPCSDSYHCSSFSILQQLQQLLHSAAASVSTKPPIINKSRRLDAFIAVYLHT